MSYVGVVTVKVFGTIISVLQKLLSLMCACLRTDRLCCVRHLHHTRMLARTKGPRCMMGQFCAEKYYNNISFTFTPKNLNIKGKHTYLRYVHCVFCVAMTCPAHNHYELSGNA